MSPDAMRRKHLKFTDFQGRQLQDLLDRHLGIQLTPQTKAVVQSAGRTVNIWVLTPALPDTTPLRAPVPPEVAADMAPTEVLSTLRYDWETADAPSDLLALPDTPLSTLSAEAVRNAALHWPRLGLDCDEFSHLQARLGWRVLDLPRHDALHHPLPEGVTPLREWLWSHRRSSHPLTRAVAAALACASFTENLLWSDLGLNGRDPLNTLFNGHFPTLYRLNTTHMGWKKFLFLKQPDRQARAAGAR